MCLGLKLLGLGFAWDVVLFRVKFLGLGFI